MPVQGAADVLQNHELTARVISHLDSLRDIIVCSAVSKSWHTIVSNLAPTILVIPGHDANLTITVTENILYWVQQKQRKGHLHNLHTLSVLLMKAPEDVATSISADALASFGQAVIAFAGLWPLTHTTLHGPFQVTQIVVLLPTTLQSLHAKVDCRQECNDDDDDERISSAMFERFDSLCSLHLVIVSPACQVRSFEVNAALPNLQCLHVSPCITTCFNDHTLLLPKLTHASLFMAKAELLQEFADLPCIQYLCLGIIQVECYVSNRLVSFVVQADSRLHELRMVVAAVIMDVKVQKSDLSYDCRGDRWAISNAATQGDACKVPIDFQPLSCSDLKRICLRERQFAV